MTLSWHHLFHPHPLPLPQLPDPARAGSSFRAFYTSSNRPLCGRSSFLPVEVEERARLLEYAVLRNCFLESNKDAPNPTSLLCAAQLVCCCCSRSFNAKQDIGATSTTTSFCRVALLTLLPYYHPYIRPDRTDALHASLPAISCRLRTSLPERQSSILIPAGPFTRFDGVSQTRVA